MKHALNCLLGIVLLTSAATSQSLIDTNKVWSVVECGNMGGCRTDFYRFKGDITIGGQSYKKLYYSHDSTMKKLYYLGAMREDSTKKVFFHQNSSEFLYYDFNLNLADTFTTYFDGNCLVQMFVDSVDTVALLNGELRRRIFLTDRFYREQWIEGVGSMKGLAHVGIDFCTFDIFPELNCFSENDSLKYQNEYYNSCYYNTLDISEINSSNALSISPNPFHYYTIVTIKSDVKNLDLIIYNTIGQKIKTIKNSSNNKIKIYRDNLPGGLYFIRIEQNNGIPAIEKMIITD